MGDPKDEKQEEQEQQRHESDHVANVLQRGDEIIGRIVLYDRIHVPMGAHGGSHIAHQRHQPGKGYGQSEQGILRPVGEVLVPNLADVPYRLARLELDLELTVKLVDLRTARSEAGGRWPESVPGIDRSSACPEDHWDYTVEPGGGMTLAFARQISWPNKAGVVLHTRFSAGPE